ncbi:hypothetical protein GOOTI_034_00040 [Gordonia otitidis NBRC 100426]|uniref:Uncharacterized protein n=1 Tax=Gordonia otitidis (strain DSM 44809 / CCUG 52243 / JCM 12355 / NBRC 100426 / IFM 10032) TaxID=1108044 RepID=H5THH9_GORO1|nr:hypothetical protein GOOTI_034_00040 [Gordonia otitidis NBRC 100426]
MRRYERERAAALRAGPAAGDGRLARWAAWAAFRLDRPPRTPGTTRHHPPHPLRRRRDADRGPDRDLRPGQIKFAVASVAVLVAAWFWAVGGALVAVAAVMAWWVLVPRVGPIRTRRLTLAGWAALTIAGVAWAGMVRAGVAATTPVRVGPLGGVPALTSAFVPVAVLAWAGIGLWVAAWLCRHALGWTPDMIADATTSGGRAVAVAADPTPPAASPQPGGDPFAFLDYDDPPPADAEKSSTTTETDDGTHDDRY